MVPTCVVVCDWLGHRLRDDRKLYVPVFQPDSSVIRIALSISARCDLTVVCDNHQKLNQTKSSSLNHKLSC